MNKLKTIKFKRNQTRSNFFELFYCTIGRIILFPFLLLLRKNNYLKMNYLPLFKIINKSFVRTPSQHFLAFWFPMIFISILGNIIDGYSMTFSIGTYIPLVIGTLLLPSGVIIYKRSSLLKRIGATKIKTYNLIIAFLVYYAVVCLFSVVLNVGVGILLFRDQQNFNIDNVIWIYYIMALFLQMILAFSIGMVIASIVKTETSAMATSLLIIIPGAFLSGQFMPLEFVNNVDFLKYFGWFFPQKGPTVLANIATNDKNPFWFHDQYKIPVNVYDNLNFMRKHPNMLSPKFKNIINNPAALKQWLDSQKILLISKLENIISVIIPLTISTICITISIKYFRWHAR